MAVNPKSLENLQKRPTKEQCKMGAYATHKVIKEKKLLRQTAQEVLSLTLNDPKMLEQIKTKFSFKGKKLDVQTAMVLVQTIQALKGDTQAYKAIESTINENKVTLDVNSNTKVLDEILGQINDDK